VSDHASPKLPAQALPDPLKPPPGAAGQLPHKCRGGGAVAVARLVGQKAPACRWEALGQR
jgi:hypothetical protein